MLKRTLAVTLPCLLLLAAVSCKSKATSSATADGSAIVGSAKLTNLSASLDAMRTAFNAHKQEARFLTLLSPA